MIKLGFSFLLLVIATTSAQAHDGGTIRILGMGQSLSLQVMGIADEVNLLTGQTAVHRKFGVGSSPYEVLQPGSEAYNVSILWSGVDVVDIIHGEGDSSHGISRELYASYLENWQAAYSEDFGFSMPIVTDQMSSLGNTWQPKIVSQIALAQWDASRVNPHIYLVGPKYQYTYDETEVHVIDEHRFWMGEMHGKAIAAVLSGADWRPLEPARAAVNGNVVTVDFYVPAPPLQIDTTTLPERPYYGFEWEDATGATLTAVEVGETWVRLILDKPVTSGMVRYAYTGTAELGSRWGNIKDSDSTPSAKGFDLSNWLIHFEIEANTVYYLPTVRR